MKRNIASVRLWFHTLHFPLKFSQRRTFIIAIIRVMICDAKCKIHD